MTIKPDREPYILRDPEVIVGRSIDTLHGRCFCGTKIVLEPFRRSFWKALAHNEPTNVMGMNVWCGGSLRLYDRDFEMITAKPTLFAEGIIARLEETITSIRESSIVDEHIRLKAERATS